MKKLFNKILKKIYVLYVTITIRIGIVLAKLEDQIFRSDYFSKGKNGVESRKYSRHTFLENFLKGQRDEQYVKDFYEILKKADNYLKSATEHEMKVSADKYARSFGKPDKDGNVYEFFGYFDSKHKYSGKTFKEVEGEILENRKIIKDNYKLEYIVTNKAIDVFDDFLSDDNKEISRNDVYRRKLNQKYTLMINRDNDNVYNKIEKLTELLHIKHVGLDLYKLEFVVSGKYKTNEFATTDSNLFEELININEVYFKETYGELVGFKINRYDYREVIKNSYDQVIYEVFVFDGNKIERSMI